MLSHLFHSCSLMNEHLLTYHMLFILVSWLFFSSWLPCNLVVQGFRWGFAGSTGVWLGAGFRGVLWPNLHRTRPWSIAWGELTFDERVALHRVDTLTTLLAHPQHTLCNFSLLLTHSHRTPWQGCHTCQRAWRHGATSAAAAPLIYMFPEYTFMFIYI